MNFDSTIRMIEQGVEEDVFPGVAYAIGNRSRVLVKGFTGSRALYPDKKPLLEDTLFDMASLSKVISTTMLALKAVEHGRICLADKLDRFFSPCYDKGDITIKQLMTHTSGIAGHMPLWTKCRSASSVIDVILKAPFVYKTGTQTVYSCLGYILLGNIIEQCFGDRLDVLAQKHIFDVLGMTATRYLPLDGSGSGVDNVAATEYVKERNSYAEGIVHDENAVFLGGVAGNAGVFSNLSDMIKFTTMLSNRGKGYMSERMFELAIQNHTVGMSESRGLGFLLSGVMPSFAGDLFSENSYGHTGFTGTSLIVDEKTGLYCLLLTNRVHFGRENDKIVRFRRQVHNSLWGNI